MLRSLTNILDKSLAVSSYDVIIQQHRRRWPNREHRFRHNTKTLKSKVINLLLRSAVAQRVFGSELTRVLLGN